MSSDQGDDEAERFFKMERQLMDRTQRNQMTLKQRLEFRKFKMLKLMVMYLQQIPLFGKYCFYGCYCFPNMGQDFTVGKGKPMDEVDSKCRDFSSCYKCLGIDYKGSCSHTQPYSFEGREDPVTKKRYLVCSKYSFEGEVNFKAKNRSLLIIRRWKKYKARRVLNDILVSYEYFETANDS